MTYIRILIEKTRAGAELNQDLMDRALGELLELEKTRDILVITKQGDWAVPYTDGNLKQLKIDAGRGISLGDFVQQVRGMGGQGLMDETYHNCSFYSHVVVHR